jgi:hypothetical protein
MLILQAEKIYVIAVLPALCDNDNTYISLCIPSSTLHVEQRKLSFHFWYLEYVWKGFDEFQI